MEDISFFDENGNIDTQYVKLSNSDKSTTYMSVISSDENNYAVKTIVNNFLLDHNADSLDNWNKTGNVDVELSVAHNTVSQKSHYGQEHIVIENTADNNYEYGMYQDVALPKGEYTFSAYIRLNDTNPEESVYADTCLRVYAVDCHCNISVISESEHIHVNDGIYTRLNTSFNLPSESTVRVCVVACGMGMIYVDALQLENNPYFNDYNMLEDGSFENGLASWTGTAGTYSSSYTPFHMTKQASIYGSLTSNRYLYQDVSVKTSASVRETFTLSGWAKAGEFTQEKATSVVRLKARINYDTSDCPEQCECEEFYAPFKPCVNEWQYAEVQFCKSHFPKVKSITVYCEYGYSSGVVYMDAVNLTRDYIEYGLKKEDFEYDIEPPETTPDEDSDQPEFAEVFDSYGNALTETTVSENGTIYRSFAYGNNSNDMTRETDARGRDTLYTVDEETSRVTSVTDRCGNTTEYEYDSMGRTTKVITEDSDVSYSYNGMGDMTEIVRGDGMKYVLEYDSFRNLEAIGVEAKSESLIRYTYRDNNGKLKKITYANGDYMTASYDRLGRMISEKWYNSYNALTYEYYYVYDGQGNIVKTIDKTGNKEYTYTYSEGNLIKSVEYDTSVTPRTRVVSIIYTYDDGELKKKRFIYGDNEEGAITFNSDGSTTTSSYGSKEASFVTTSATDDLGRKMTDSVKGITRTFTYHDGTIRGGNNVLSQNNVTEPVGKYAPTTQLVASITYSGGRTISYEYDNEERITKVADSIEGITEYTYDTHGQLLTETKNGAVVNTMTYDGYGNITSKNSVVYCYCDTWSDLLTSYGSQSITYDAQGNPTTYRGKALVWEKGRQLKSYDGITYTYNANGIRTSKTVNGTRHTYILDGTKILRETWDNNALVPLYDSDDSVCGISFNGTSYFFVKNLQGDVIEIADAAKTIVARYSYDAWGKCTVECDTADVSIATINPYRYRGYYYDAEIGLYYLQSRYYDAEVGRFINGDEAEYLTFFNDILQRNLFSYCLNAPIDWEDLAGNISLKGIISSIKGFIGKLINKIWNHILSLFRWDKTKKTISVGTATIATVIDATIAGITNALIYRGLKTGMKLLLRSNKVRSSLVKCMLDFFLKNFWGKKLLWLIYKVGLSIAGKASVLGTVASGVFTSYLDSIWSFKNRLLQRSYSLLSALSSVGGIVALFLDIGDNKWDDWVTIRYQ